MRKLNPDIEEDSITMKFKNILPSILSGLLLVLMVIALISKKDINDKLSGLIKEQFRQDLDESVSTRIDSLYNYTVNGSAFETTFLEFGADNCSACRKMVKVLDQIRISDGDRVNVVFLNVMLPENQVLMKYFGIAAIPTQIILNGSAQEIFRHTGYISASELEKSFVEE